MIKARFPDFYRRTLYILVSISWISGVAFFALSRWFMVEGDFGPMRHPWQFPALMTHGAVAFLLMFAFGFILASHVPVTWKLKQFRNIGLLLIFIVSFQMISAYCLYYLANEDMRDIIANVHAAIGFSFPFILLIHIIQGIRRRKKTAKVSLKY